MTTELTAHCERSQGWWAVTVPEVDGLYTQARRLDQVPAMVVDAAALLTDRPESDFTVTVIPALSAEDEATVASVKEARQRLHAAEDEAARINRRAAARLAAQGLTVRDIGTILGVSPQRAHQLAAA